MSVKRFGPFSVFLLVPAGISIAIYTGLGVIGTWIFGGRINGAKDLLYVLNPLLAFPLFLVIFSSIRLAVGLLWVYFLYTWAYSIVLSWPQRVFTPFNSSADWILFAGVVLVSLSMMNEIRISRSDTRTAGRPGSRF